jgi:superfamily I DNA/RNA helicase
MVMETLRKVRKLGEIESNPEKVLTTLLKTFTPTAPNGFEQKLRARSLAKYAPRYLLEEIEWLIEGRGLDTLAEYEKAPRPGRGVALGAKMRGVIWELYRSYSELLKKSQKETFASLRHEAARVATQDGFVSPFDYVLVDEAQDLAPVTLQFVAHLAKSAEGLFFAADNKQSIYSKGSGWSSADARLQFKGRTSQLSQNYRSTAQLDSAAFELLETEPGEEAPAASKSAHEGPLPVLLKLSKPQNESKWLAQFLKQMAKYLGVQTHAAAVLVPDKETGAAVALELTGKGIPARFFGSKTLDLKTAEVKVLTMHSAKGLEFPTVVVTGLKAGAYPTPEQFPEEPEVYQEALRLHRRLLYVACTRAMRGLMVVVPKDCSDEVLVPLMTSKSGRWVQQEGK